MKDDLRQQIYDNFNQKETEELFEIWQINDRKDWTDTAFEVLRQILHERLDQLPDQPALPDQTPEEETDEDLDEEIWPEFYDPMDVVLLDQWINNAAIAAIVITAILNLLKLSDLQMTASAIFHLDNQSLANVLSLLIAIFWAFLNTAIEFIVVYIPLKVLAYILKILMETEFDSRGSRFTLQDINEIIQGDVE